MLWTARSVEHIKLITKLGDGIEIYESAEENIALPSGYNSLVGAYVGIREHCQGALSNWREMFSGSGQGGLVPRWDQRMFLLDSGRDTFGQGYGGNNRKNEQYMFKWVIKSAETGKLQFTDPRWTTCFPKVIYHSDSMIINSLVEQLACTAYGSDDEKKVIIITIPDYLANSKIIKSLCGAEAVTVDLGRGLKSYSIEDVYSDELYGWHLNLDRDLQLDSTGESILTSAVGNDHKGGHPFKPEYFDRVLNILGVKNGRKRNAYGSELDVNGLIHKFYEKIAPYIGVTAKDPSWKVIPVVLFRKSSFVTQFKDISIKSNDLTPHLSTGKLFQDKAKADTSISRKLIPRIVSGQDTNRYEIVPEIVITGSVGLEYSCYLTEADKLILVCSSGDMLPSDIFKDLAEEWKKQIRYTDESRVAAIIPTENLVDLINFLAHDESCVDMRFIREVDPSLDSVKTYIHRMFEDISGPEAQVISKRKSLILRREEEYQDQLIHVMHEIDTAREEKRMRELDQGTDKS